MTNNKKTYNMNNGEVMKNMEDLRKFRKVNFGPNVCFGFLLFFCLANGLGKDLAKIVALRINKDRQWCDHDRH